VGRAVVFVRGYQAPHVAKALQEASRAGAALSAATGTPVNVEPLIIIHGASVTGWLLRHPRGVKILPSRAANWWLRLPGRATLRSADIETLYAAARDPGTWRRA